MPDTHPEGVPLNIWPCPPGSGSRIRQETAAKAIAAYAPTGGTVVDLHPGDGECLAAAASSGRNAVVLPMASLTEGRWRCAAVRGLAGVADVVLALPPAARLVPPRACGSSSLAAAALAEQAAMLLRPGGFFVLGVVPREGRDDVAEAVAAVTAGCFSYFQHIVALLASPEHCGEDEARRVAHADLLVFERRAS